MKLEENLKCRVILKWRFDGDLVVIEKVAQSPNQRASGCAV
jgi:hypothetical protein